MGALYLTEKCTTKLRPSDNRLSRRRRRRRCRRSDRVQPPGVSRDAVWHNSMNDVQAARRVCGRRCCYWNATAVPLRELTTSRRVAAVQSTLNGARQRGWRRRLDSRLFRAEHGGTRDGQRHVWRQARSGLPSTLDGEYTVGTYVTVDG